MKLSIRFAASFPTGQLMAVICIFGPKLNGRLGGYSRVDVSNFSSITAVGWLGGRARSEWVVLR
ncbi:unnamed protein product [Protopolystoma xenopodis]|uniref:Uncharacterized protein n=1 Tax=Protopolystoma xenopodis TaxID=117903 RepID=A0A3S5AV83_9PLAT|nr:unnamed protein product [Protopolystoma xenopodis]